jgi:hypothetical protein
MKPVVTELIANVKENKNATRHADGESGDVDERIAFVAQQISNSDDEIVFEHGDSSYQLSVFSYQ